MFLEMETLESHISGVNLPIYKRMNITKYVIVKPLSLICENLEMRDFCKLHIYNQ